MRREDKLGWSHLRSPTGGPEMRLQKNGPPTTEPPSFPPCRCKQCSFSRTCYSWTSFAKTQKALVQAGGLKERESERHNWNGQNEVSPPPSPPSPPRLSPTTPRRLHQRANKRKTKKKSPQLQKLSHSRIARPRPSNILPQEVRSKSINSDRPPPLSFLFFGASALHP